MRRYRGAVGESGSVLPGVCVAVAAAVVTVVAILGLAERAVHRARAQTAADVAALAALSEGRSGARELADLNDAVMVAYDESGPVVRVVVSLRGVEAEASAAWEWESILLDPPR